MGDSWASEDGTVDMQRSFALAETLSKIGMMSPAVKKRLAARSIELKFGHLDEDSGAFVPPKQFLLYLVSLQNLRVEHIKRNCPRETVQSSSKMLDVDNAGEEKILTNVKLQKVILQRMGSFTSSPKIQNDDNQDDEFRIPIGISRFELIHFCQTQPMVQPMVKRSFRRAAGPNDDTYDLKYRKLSGVTKGCSGDYVSGPHSLRIFQWNILSQALGQMNDHFVRCPDEALEWNSRKFRIIEEIVEYCPDIICLQEVDHFNFLKHVLGTQGYTGVFYPKPDSPCVYINGNNGPDGCAIFYRTNKFDLINVASRILEIWRVQSNQVALLANLRVRETGQEVCVTTTHLKARHGAFLATLRNEQGKDLLQFVTQHCGNRPLVLSGDFNAEPSEPIYNTILAHECLKLGSAYADCDNVNADSAKREPPYTTWKIRDEGEICHTIDYVFYKKDSLELEAVLELPTEEEIGEDRVPSYSYPSDHFSLVCDFKMKNGQMKKALL